jgi:hypothetical protein
MTGLPPDLQDLLDQVDAADRAGASLAAAVTDEQFHWQPLGGRGWSIAQCLEHLAVMNRFYGAAVRTGIDDARRRHLTRTGPGRSTYFGRRFVRSQEPPVKWKLKAPAQLGPVLARPREDVLRAYLDAHVFVRQLIADAADIDLNRATFQNPFIRVIRMRVATGLAILPAHDRRHLWQAEQVRTAPGFPVSR